MPSSTPADATPYHLRCALDLDGELHPLFPVLLPASRERTANELLWPVPPGNTKPPVAWVTLASLVGQPFTSEFRVAHLHPRQLRALGKTPNEVWNEAHANLCARPASWRELSPDTLLCSDDILASERLLDGEFLREAGVLLGVPGRSLVIAVPEPGCLLAMSRRAYRKRETGAAFARAVANIFDASGRRGLVREPIAVVGGKLERM